MRACGFSQLALTSWAGFGTSSTDTQTAATATCRCPLPVVLSASRSPVRGRNQSVPANQPLGEVAESRPRLTQAGAPVHSIIDTAAGIYKRA
jgi:hypothetical protein